MNPECRIRPYREEDEEGVVSLWREVFAGDPAWNEPALVIERKLAVQRHLFLVGEAEGEIVATVLAGYDGFRGWVYHLAVSPPLRRRGIGGAMMRAAEVGLRGLGCPKVNLQVRAGNEEAVRFYESLGYRAEDRVSMGRRLDDARVQASSAKQKSARPSRRGGRGGSR